MTAAHAMVYGGVTVGARGGGRGGARGGGRDGGCGGSRGAGNRVDMQFVPSEHSRNPIEAGSLGINT